MIKPLKLNDMKPDLKQALESLKSVICLSVDANDDVFAAPLVYLSGDFSIAELPNYGTLNDVFAAMDPMAEISIGIGFETYRTKIRESLASCAETGKNVSFMLPLWDAKKTHSFFMTAARDGDKLNMLLFLFGETTKMMGVDRLVADSFKDQLTGLFNARTMEQHVAANRRDGYLCFFDLNKFKAINDTYGHGVGDDVLCLIASFLISIASKNEVFYRRSGDEFMAIIFLHDYEYTLGLINRIEAYLESIPKVALKQLKGFECSASFGLLELRYEGGKEGIPLEERLKLIDLAMYQAKKGNRRYHLITHEDALEILEQGNLDERLKELAASIKR